MGLRTGQVMINLYKRTQQWKNLEGENFERYRQILLMIADDIISVCDKHNLNYCLAYGTALGAIRHKGFIPWDDDVDIFIPRSDYDKFLEIAPAELGDKYYIRCVSKGDRMSVATCHVKLKGTKYINYSDLVLYDSLDSESFGIYVDIAPLDNTSNFSLIRYLSGVRCLYYLFAASCVRLLKSVDYLIENGVVINKEEMKALRLKLFLGKIFSYRSDSEWVRKYDLLTSSYRKEDSDYVSCYTAYKKIKKEKASIISN